MILVLILEDGTTISYSNVVSHVYNTEKKEMTIFKDRKLKEQYNIKNYALFSNNGEELLKVTLGVNQ